MKLISKLGNSFINSVLIGCKIKFLKQVIVSGIHMINKKVFHKYLTQNK